MVPLDKPCKGLLLRGRGWCQKDPGGEFRLSPPPPPPPPPHPHKPGPLSMASHAKAAAQAVPLLSNDAVLWRGGVGGCTGKPLKSLKTLGASGVLIPQRQLAKRSMGAPFPGRAGRRDRASLPSWKVPFLEPETAPSSWESCPGAPANPNTLVCVGGPLSAGAGLQKAAAFSSPLTANPHSKLFLLCLTTCPVSTMHTASAHVHAHMCTPHTLGGFTVLTLAWTWESKRPPTWSMTYCHPERLTKTVIWATEERLKVSPPSPMKG